MRTSPASRWIGLSNRAAAATLRPLYTSVHCHMRAYTTSRHLLPKAAVPYTIASFDSGGTIVFRLPPFRSWGRKLQFLGCR
ncbi:hypothetical protein VTO73DRAFT_10658 [Trametes versicolor]